MEVKIVNYKPDYREHFENLNKAWLNEYFVVEPIDKWVLENPEEAILKEGGRIMFAAYEGEVIGTVALRWAEGDVLELTKMAVDKTFQGLGAGKLLCEAAIEEAKKMNAKRLILYSNTTLPTAIGIYRKMGFIETPLEKGKYARADIKMEMLLGG